MEIEWNLYSEKKPELEKRCIVIIKSKNRWAVGFLSEGERFKEERFNWEYAWNWTTYWSEPSDEDYWSYIEGPDLIFYGDERIEISDSIEGCGIKNLINTLSEYVEDGFCKVSVDKLKFKIYLEKFYGDEKI